MPLALAKSTAHERRPLNVFKLGGRAGDRRFMQASPLIPMQLRKLARRPEKRCASSLQCRALARLRASVAAAACPRRPPPRWCPGHLCSVCLRAATPTPSAAGWQARCLLRQHPTMLRYGAVAFLLLCCAMKCSLPPATNWSRSTGRAGRGEQAGRGGRGCRQDRGWRDARDNAGKVGGGETWQGARLGIVCAGVGFGPLAWQATRSFSLVSVCGCAQR